MNTVKKQTETSRIKELEEQVAFYRAQSERLTAAMSEFTHTAAHDLKAPLTRISYYCGLLKEDGASSLNDECRGYIDRMQVNVRRSQRLIDDLQAYSRTLHNEEEKTKTDLAGLVGRVVDDMAPMLVEARAKVSIENLPQACVCPMHTRQLFQNLLLNALNYKSPDRALVIKVDCKDEGDCYLFSVGDNGIGIDKKYHEKIFKPFERLHTQDEIEGSGLGLAAAARIVEMHQGKIWVDSTPGIGSTFFFVFRK